MGGPETLGDMKGGCLKPLKLSLRATNGSPCCMAGSRVFFEGLLFMSGLFASNSISEVK